LAVLNTRTPFGITEQNGTEAPMSVAVQRATAALPRLGDVARRSGAPGLVLTSPATVAWATGGANPPVDRTAAIDVVWVVVPTEGAATNGGSVHVLTTEVEAPRLRGEGPFAQLGWPVVAVPWWEPGAFVRAAERVLDQPASVIASDGHSAFGINASHDLVATRMALTAPDVEAMRALARDAAVAVEQSLKQWTPGESDRVIAGRIAENTEVVGACAPVLLVGGDDRLRDFRHPVASGNAVDDVVMAVLVASRGGLHVALTRYAARPAAAADLSGLLDAARMVHTRVLKRCVPGVTAGAVLDELDSAYAAQGYAQAWRQHYQGGPIAYAQREFEITPGQRSSEWWDQRLEAKTALAWNPSLPGGAKDEDTYLLDDGGLELLTQTGHWPTIECDGLTRPSVLLVEN
jgi:Xaa-Pro aminopeptidase